jgi:hypothetical protein
MSDQAQLQPVLPYSVKVEQTAKGARISVHVYGKTAEDVTEQVVQLYTNVKKQLVASGHVVAPIDSDAAWR